MSRYFSFLVLLAVIILLVILLYRVMASFLVPIFLASILVVVFRPTHVWILEKVGGKQTIAAGITTAGILLSVLIPITLLVLLGVYEGRQMIQQITTGSIVEKINRGRSGLGLDIPAKNTLSLVRRDLDALPPNGLDPDDPFEVGKFEDLERALRQLGSELELPELETDGEPTEPQTVSERKWLELITQVDHIRSELDSLENSTHEDEQPSEIIGGINQALFSLSGHFGQFQSSLLGGSFWTRVKMMANPSEDELHRYEASLTSFLRDKLFSIGGATTAFLGRLLLGLAIMTVALYFFLLDGPRMLETIKGLSPIDDEHEEELIQEFNNVSRAVVVATLLSAIIQGILAGIGFYFVGMESVFLLTLLTACLALVPFAGAAAVWVPVCLWLYFVDNHFWSALGLGIYGVTIVSMADNFIKPYVLHGQSNLHPLLALLSVLGGVTALGPIGILVGPMVVVFLQTLLNILQRELMSMETSNPGNVKQNEHHNNEVSRWNSMTHT